MLGRNLTPHRGLSELSEHCGTEWVCLDIARSVSDNGSQHWLRALTTRFTPFKASKCACSSHLLSLLLTSVPAITSVKQPSHAVHFQDKLRTQGRKCQLHCPSKALHQKLLGCILQVQWSDLNAPHRNVWWVGTEIMVNQKHSHVPRRFGLWYWGRSLRWWHWRSNKQSCHGEWNTKRDCASSVEIEPTYNRVQRTLRKAWLWYHRWSLKWK